MAFLEKPFILSELGLADQAPVNYNLMKSFAKLDKDDVRNVKGKHCIVFQSGEAHQAGQTIEWRYPDKECRDKEYSNIVAKISLPLSTE